jgi:peptidoglycan/xylan/chitin deacetylase (PgdA/CDA1 family)
MRLGTSQATVAPLVSVVMAARNAVITIPDALSSLQSQTFENWEAIVVDDGSTDATAATVEAIRAGDPRIRILRQKHTGPSEARNAGARLARGDWLLFFDADDLLLPDAVGELVRATRSEHEVGVAYCRYARVDRTGRTRLAESELCPSGDLFDELARRCVFACHCALVRRTLFELLGGFDAAVVACEDWDLWQRIARTGAHFQGVDEALALYRTHSGSRSMDIAALVADALRIVERGHDRDPRVATPAPEHAEGASRERLPIVRLGFHLWGAAAALGKGEAPDLRGLESVSTSTVSPEAVAQQVYEAFPIGACAPELAWPDLLASHGVRIDRFLDDLGRFSSYPLFATRTRRLLERRILADDMCSAPRALGSFAVGEIDLTTPLDDLPVAADLLHCCVRVGPDRLGSIELPVCDDLVPAYVLADAAADRYGWDLLGRHFEAIDVRYDRSRHDEVGWLRFLRELWDEPELEIEGFYQPVEASELTAQCTDGVRVSLEVSEHLSDIQVDADALLVEVVVGGSPIGAFHLPGRREITAAELRASVTTVAGLELCRAAVREALVGEPLEGATLRQRLRAAARSRSDTDRVRARVQPPESTFVFGRRLGALGTSASRRAAFPSDALQDLRAAAAAHGEPTLTAGRDARVIYAPEVYCSSVPTAPFAVNSKPRDSRTSHNEASDTDSPPARTLPILMYHRISDEVTEALAQYAVAPDTFEEQLAYLEHAGYRSVSLEEWRVAAHLKRPLPRRAVAITFDDGYVDFAEEAWPRLRKHGFTADVFLVAALVGATNEWDGGDGKQFSLLGWDRVRRLQSEGVRFGAHSATHPPLTGLPNGEIVREAARSRAILRAELGRPAAAFAYPFGDVDAAVAHLVGASGFVFGLTTESRRATFDDSLLMLPRINVDRSDSLDHFIRKLDEPP